MTSCVGLGPGFENNGRCDIPFFCSDGTDCHDCNDDITPNVFSYHRLDIYGMKFIHLLKSKALLKS